MPKKKVYDNDSISSLKGADRVRKRPGVADDRTVLVGHSYGGIAALAAAARKPAGVRAVINVSGGAGGDRGQQLLSQFVVNRIELLGAIERHHHHTLGSTHQDSLSAHAGLIPK